MCNSECVPENDIGVDDIRVGVRGDPGRQTFGGFARGLGDVASGGVDLCVFVYVLCK
jgi:hypothetical protein